MTTMPPFPTQPSRQDWRKAAAIIGERLAEGWYSTSLQHSDPIGCLVAVARDTMRTRHTRTRAYRAYLTAVDAERQAAEAAQAAARERRVREMTAKERAAEATFYADGGTAIEWAIQQEATEQAKADNAKKRATSRMRAKARSTPTRKRTRATAPTTKDTQ